MNFRGSGEKGKDATEAKEAREAKEALAAEKAEEAKEEQQQQQQQLRLLRVLQLRRTAVLGGAQGAPGNVWEHLCLMHEHAGVPEVAEKLGCF